MRREAAYASVFSSTFPLRAWPRIARVLRRTDKYLEGLRRAKGGMGSRFLKEWRQITAYISVARVLGRFSFGGRDMETFDPSLLTDDVFAETWQLVERERGATDRSKAAKSKAFVKRCCAAAAAEFGITNAQAVEAREPFRYVGQSRPLDAGDRLIEAVETELPEQPWKPGAHADVASRLGVPPRRVSRAIATLIATRRRNRQRDGVVFDADGNVLAVDVERMSAAGAPIKSTDD